MKRLQAVAGVLGVLLALVPGVSAQDVPDPPHVHVLPADVTEGPIIAPGHPSPITACVQTITIYNAVNAPLVGAFVEVLFPAGTPLCPDAAHTGITDDLGRVVIALTGGGCLEEQHSCTIRANGVYIRDYSHARSPDLDGNLVVDLRDLIRFALDYFQRLPGCSDYNDNGMTDLPDVMIFAPAFAPQHSCP